ncbi:multidrug efflux SMR transporter [Guyparkeria hydrothermalis]|uniref:Guanidinium exporter n=1 Tax=Guyparkeria halophila TaxID=47960 RepID=A0A6I6CX76_9GAMM|nr:MULTISPECIES: multidrug efflux SMR transporter [Guyparkeria]MCL7751478.1 multidrug efflux SMR transporter [Guyparkeria hydrothermalis]QGT77950.1 QacE family quaternary ammonium compound efflux SMR transporter [Guyparkeria halophila]TKA88567.1 multidrug efflux SMR transporter [Guyparkeria sp. SB14A]
MNAWLILLAAGLLEIVWATGLRFTDGFSRLVPTVIVLAIAWASFYLLALAMREIPMGTAYAIWTGIGATGVAILGILWFKEPATAARLGFIALIVIGIVGLKWSSGNH